MNGEDPVISLEGVDVTFGRRSLWGQERVTKVLDNVSLTIGRGEIVAVVGESGCGKTTLGKVMTGLVKPTAGTVRVHAHEPAGRGRRVRPVQLVQQDSYAALNPARTVLSSLRDPLVELGVAPSRRQAVDLLRDLFRLVELTPAEQFWSKYPHQLSGGQRQRVILARALSMSPALIVADEPVSMIDVSLRLSVLGLMTRVNVQREIAFLYITHDLSTAHYIAHRGRLVVMYLGRIVETGPLAELLAEPRHPYLHALLAAVPVPDPHVAKAKRALPLTTMEMGDLSAVPSGCPFHPRCPYADAVCIERVPVPRAVGASLVACHHAEEIVWKSTAEVHT